MSDTSDTMAFSPLATERASESRSAVGLLVIGGKK